MNPRRAFLLLLIVTVLATAGAVVIQLLPTAASAAGALAPYRSCDEALADLKDAARRTLQESRRETDSRPPEDTATAPGAVPESGAAADRSAPAHSTTTVNEAGVDEPDLVKTDGRRIVSVAGGVLRVIDPTTRRVTESPDRRRVGDAATVSLHADRALVVTGSAGRASGRSGYRGGEHALTLFDLGTAGTEAKPRELGSLSTTGGYLDARQVGSVVRVVVRSAPKLRSERAIEDSSITDWLPPYRVERDGVTNTHTVPCDRISRPAAHSGTSILTVLTIDLVAAGMGEGDPMAVVADGQTVYGTGASLYVANVQRPFAADRPGRQAETELFKFDVTRPGRPVYLAGGAVPGGLLNQYSLSEHAGVLRVATTSTASRESASQQSSVHLLRTDGQRLVTAGRVDGLGRGERIYAVRFVGPVGYVVTFKRTDPLYTLDLRDPSHPRVTGELKINGYSAYLHPVDAGRLIGVGQEASAGGQVQGSQVSLFDVNDPAAPTRLAQHFVPGARSEVEVDPHAFLYWPQTGTVVLPVQGRHLGGPDGGSDSPSGSGAALILRLDGDRFSEVGTIVHPGMTGEEKSSVMIRRSLVIGDTLWTISGAGLMAHEIKTAAVQAWVPFDPGVG